MPLTRVAGPLLDSPMSVDRHLCRDECSEPERVIGRRAVLGAGIAAAVPAIVRAEQRLSLDFRTIHDPDGWHPSLRLKGDWLVFAISDGRLTGFGEASHSRDDAACRTAARELFDRRYRDFPLSLDALRRAEAETAALEPDFITATALSGLNQALYDLLAKREGVPVWQLFSERVAAESVPLYTTINRALETRSVDEYLDIVADAVERGFATIKCAPFEAVSSPALGLTHNGPGFERLEALRARFPSLGIRVDFHERFDPDDFLTLVPRLESLGIDWLEEPFPFGDAYTRLKRATTLDISGGELFWGRTRFAEIAASGWVDVIMPDVKHVGGFGPLLDVIEATRDRVRISPHNPSGPISTAASLHAALLHPEAVRSLEFAFDRDRVRPATGERVDNGRLYIGHGPGWGVEPPA